MYSGILIDSKIVLDESGILTTRGQGNKSHQDDVQVFDIIQDQMAIRFVYSKLNDF